ncbi:hypothetical protein BDK51DRAFT_49303 [Blyttiomyces helicus]|uniref:Galactose oxidase n=1 Tax=Blyttiomyces helicus TaxID=388810 RepID=A0A4P9VWY1_9FUNG|nr:hypothetical protein BDK51DRAFT_49303 [Blyttiomyces helicus]|eukprot:RKO84229.1 hypothetical protein BDK51DRAFT_49303 [Blyttiomyces helicus]
MSAGQCAGGRVSADTEGEQQADGTEELQHRLPETLVLARPERRRLLLRSSIASRRRTSPSPSPVTACGADTALLMRLPPFYAVCLWLTPHVAHADSPSNTLAGVKLLTCPDIQNAIFMFGGYFENWFDSINGNKTATLDVWKYDTPSSLWTKLPAPNAPVSSQYASFGVVAVCIGSTIFGTLSSGTFASYNLTSNLWNTSLPQPNASISYAAAFALGDGNAYFVGNWNRSAGSSTLVYNSTANKWTNGPTYPHPVSGAGAAATTAGIGFVFGGSSSGKYYNDIRRLNQSGWSEDLGHGSPYPRDSMCFAAWNESLVLWGGANAVATNISTETVNTFIPPQGWLPPTSISGRTGVPATASCAVVGSVLYIWPHYRLDPDVPPPMSLLQLNLETSKWIAGPRVVPKPAFAPPSPSSSATSSSSSSPATTTANSSASTNTGMIAGVAVAVVLLALALYLALLYILYRRRRAADKALLTPTPEDTPPESRAPSPQISTSSTRPPRPPAPREPGNHPEGLPAYHTGIGNLPDPVVADTPDTDAVVYRGLSEFVPRVNDEVAVSFADEIVVR